jgi:hypothetical protein
MSIKISKKRFVELLRTILKKEIAEASTTATAGGEYDTPHAFSGKGKDRRKSIASGSGFQKVGEGRNPEIPRTKTRLLKLNAKYLADDLMDMYKELGKPDVDSALVVQHLDTLKEKVKMMRKNVGLRESVNESGIMYRAGVKKYGKEGMTKIQQAAGKKASHAEIGKIKDKYDKTREIPKEVTEDAKDVTKAKKLSQKLQNIEGRYRKVMYDLSDRLQADDKNHKLQDELIKSYTKNVTSFMRDMIKITKRVK